MSSYLSVLAFLWRQSGAETSLVGGYAHFCVLSVARDLFFFVLNSERCLLDGYFTCAFKDIHVNMLITQSCWKVAFVRSRVTHHLGDAPSALASSSCSPSSTVLLSVSFPQKPLGSAIGVMRIGRRGSSRMNLSLQHPKILYLRGWVSLSGLVLVYQFLVLCQLVS